MSISQTISVALCTYNGEQFLPSQLASIASQTRLPDELVQTAPDVYIRFHGTKRWYRHDYTRDELRVWADRIKVAKPARVWEMS